MTSGASHAGPYRAVYAALVFVGFALKRLNTETVGRMFVRPTLKFFISRMSVWLMRSRYIVPGGTRSTVGGVLENARPSVRPGVVFVSGNCAFTCAPGTLWYVNDALTP